MLIELNLLREPLLVNEEINLKEYIDNIPDILDIKRTSVFGTIRLNNGIVYAELSINSSLILACAKTLKPVDYELSFDTTIVFGNNNESDFELSPKILLDPIIFGYILVEKPYVVYHEDAKNESFEVERSPHPAFSELNKTKT